MTKQMYIRDKNMKQLGMYDAKADITLDDHGRPVCKGNLLMLLVPRDK